MHQKREKILLDVLNEDCHYNEVLTLPIESRFIQTVGETNSVKVYHQSEIFLEIS